MRAALAVVVMELTPVGAGVLEGLDDGVALRLGEGSVVDENLEGFADSLAAFGSGLLRLDDVVLSAGDRRGEEGGAGGDTAERGGRDGGDGDGALDRGGGHDGCCFLEGMECERGASRIPILGLPGKTIVRPPGSGDEEGVRIV